MTWTEKMDTSGLTVTDRMLKESKGILQQDEHRCSQYHQRKASNVLLVGFLM
jgi:hypothetical protein